MAKPFFLLSTVHQVRASQEKLHQVTRSPDLLKIFRIPVPVFLK